MMRRSRCTLGLGLAVSVSVFAACSSPQPTRPPAPSGQQKAPAKGEPQASSSTDAKAPGAQAPQPSGPEADMKETELRFVDERTYQRLAGVVAVIGTARLVSDARGVVEIPADAERAGGGVLVQYYKPGYVARIQMALPGRSVRLVPLDPTVSRVAASAGGTFRNAEGNVRVEIAPGALDRDTEIRLTRLYSEHAEDARSSVSEFLRTPAPGESGTWGSYGCHVDYGGARLQPGGAIRLSFKVEPRLLWALQRNLVDLPDTLRRDPDGSYWFDMAPPVPPAAGAAQPGGYRLMSGCNTYDDTYTWIEKRDCKSSGYRLAQGETAEVGSGGNSLSLPAGNLAPLNPIVRRPSGQDIVHRVDYTDAPEKLREIFESLEGPTPMYDPSIQCYVIDRLKFGGNASVLHHDFLLGDLYHEGEAAGTSTRFYQGYQAECLYRRFECPDKGCDPERPIAVFAKIVSDTDLSANRLVWLLPKECPKFPEEPPAAARPVTDCPPGDPACAPVNRESLKPIGGTGQPPMPPRVDVITRPCDITHIEHYYSQDINARVTWHSDDARIGGKPVAGAGVSFSHPGTRQRAAVLAGTTGADGIARGVGAKGASGSAQARLDRELEWTYGTSGIYSIGCGPVELKIVKNRPKARLAIKTFGKPPNGPFSFTSTIGTQKVPDLNNPTIPLDNCDLTKRATPVELTGSWKHDANCQVENDSPKLEAVWNQTHLLDPVRVWFSRDIGLQLSYNADIENGPADQVPSTRWHDKTASAVAVTFEHPVSEGSKKDPLRDKLSFTGVDGGVRTWGLSHAPGRATARVTGPDGTVVIGNANYTIANNTVDLRLNAQLPQITCKVGGELGTKRPYEMKYELVRSDGQGKGVTRVMSLPANPKGQWVFTLPVEEPVGKPYTWTFTVIDIWGTGEEKEYRILAPDLAFEFTPLKVQRGKVYTYPGEWVGQLTTAKYRVH